MGDFHFSWKAHVLFSSHHRGISYHAPPRVGFLKSIFVSYLFCQGCEQTDKTPRSLGINVDKAKPTQANRDGRKGLDTTRLFGSHRSPDGDRDVVIEKN